MINKEKVRKIFNELMLAKNNIEGNDYEDAESNIANAICLLQLLSAESTLKGNKPFPIKFGNS